MRGELFLLALACVSFVRVRGDHNSENPLERGSSMLTEANLFAELYKTEIQPSNREVNTKANQELKDAISEALLVINSVYEIAVKIAERHWTNLNDIREGIARHGKEFAEAAKRKEDRFANTLSRVADQVKEEARNLNNYQLIAQCVDREEQKGNGKTKTELDAAVSRIEYLNTEFNKDYPEHPFVTLEKHLKNNLNQANLLIKGCNKLECVAEKTQDYISDTTAFCDAQSTTVTQAFHVFINQQHEVRTLDTKVTKKIEQIFLATVQEIRQCLYIRKTILGKMLACN